jgi:hypothetical protein
MWFSLLLAGWAVQAVLAAWAGWRVVRSHAGGLWAAALGGAVIYAGPIALIFGLAWATASSRPVGFQDAPTLSAAEFGGFAFLATIAAMCGLVGAVLARVVERRHAT